MNRRLGWVLVTFGLLLAIGTGTLVFVLLRQQESRALDQARAETLAAKPVIATMQLPVAARPIEPGVVLTDQDMLLKDFPLDLVPVTAITSTVSLANQVVIEPIGQGETFSNRQLAGEHATTLSGQIPQGRVIFAYPIADLLTEVDIIRDGDRIDMLITLPLNTAEGESNMSSAFTLQNIDVFRVLRPTSEEGQPAGAPIALLLAMRPEDAVILKQSKDSGGVIDFVLRSTLDQEPFEAPSINRADLLARYEFR